jgi:hypothetical protein
MKRMKILELAPYVFIENHPSASRKQTGLAYMVRSICDMLASNNEVQVITQAVITKEMHVNSWMMVGRSYFDNFRHFKLRYFMQSIKNYMKCKELRFARTFLYCISAGRVEESINVWKPDVIDVHGITPGT